MLVRLFGTGGGGPPAVAAASAAIRTASLPPIATLARLFGTGGFCSAGLLLFGTGGGTFFFFLLLGTLGGGGPSIVHARVLGIVPCLASRVANDVGA